MGVAIAPGERLKGRYRLQRLLGRGGMAAVWLGHDEVLDRPVAVKVLSDTIASDPEFVARFRREAQTAAGLNHPNLVGVFDFSEGEERPYLVMQFVPGEDLGQVLAEGGYVDCERLAQELLDALAHIHAVGILHRDVKPGNILIDGEGTARLIDFGIAQPADATALTRTGLILGTERYAAPEVLRGEPATERSDLYSCGVVLRACAENAGGSAALRSLSAWLASEDPRARPASARQALARLQRPAVATEPEPTQALRPPPAPAADPASTGRSRSGIDRDRSLDEGWRAAEPAARWGAALALGAIVIVLAGLAIVLAGGDGPSHPGRAHAGKLSGEGKRQRGGGSGAAEGAAAGATETAASTEPPAPEGSDPGRAAALNEEGFALIQAGDYEAAVPVLEAAVRAFPAGTEDIDYAYALYNLGNALRLSGRPEAAIPVLERRLEIPDQTATVERELEAARAEAG